MRTMLFSKTTPRIFQSAFLAGTFLLCLPASVSAQTVHDAEAAALPAASGPSANTDMFLPDAPQPELRASTVEAPKTATLKPAPKYAKYIPSNEQAYSPLTLHDKIVIGARDLYSTGSLLDIVASGSYSQVLDGQPNYGHPNSYGKRLGAAAISETSEGVFTDMVFAPLLHQDSRYFQMGRGRGFFPRTFYAVSRVLVTRTDGGRETINGALLLGYAGSTALSQTYYPQINRDFHDAASSYGGSLGGAALGFLVQEFTSDVLHVFHKNSGS